MIRRALRGSVRFIESAGFATTLLLVLGAWSLLATLVPQERDSAQKVLAWAAAHPALEPTVRFLGLHRAFGSVIFIACAGLLAVSTALCAWRRTRAALRRMQTLRKAGGADLLSVSADRDFEIACDPALSESAILTVASDVLERLGIKTRRGENVLSAVSSPWSVLGSPIFHWALLLLIVAILFSTLQRSEGQMGVAVGQTRPDARGSYGVLHSGPLHDWRTVRRSIRVEAFEPTFRSGGIDRGPTPTVAVLDRTGKAVKTQRVYPNMTLKTGSLTIYPMGWGLSTTLSLVDSSGVVTGSAVRLVDFQGKAPEGTEPVGRLGVVDYSGNPALNVSVTVPLDGTPGAFDMALPKKPTARVLVTSLDGKTVMNQVLSPGEEITLPVGRRLRLDNVRHYARLQLVDDLSLSVIYAGFVVAIIGLIITVAARQQVVLATVMEDADGMKLALKIRLWRNASSSRQEIESELVLALSGAEKGSTS